MSAPARCPKHGTVLITPSGPDDPPPWCWPCWNVHRQRLPGPDIEGACLAMSRFLVWVWCEATAVAESAIFTELDCPVPVHVCRVQPLKMALERGLLRLEWSR